MNDYMDGALRTAVYPDRGSNIAYPALGLAGEAGEVANVVKKIYRDNGGKIGHDVREKIRDELGDVLWYVAAVAYEAGLSLEDIAKSNIDKLASRRDRGALHGSGDKR